MFLALSDAIYVCLFLLKGIFDLSKIRFRILNKLTAKEFMPPSSTLELLYFKILGGGGGAQSF